MTCRCIHAVDGECRLHPPVVLNARGVSLNPSKYEGNWGFPPATVECGQQVAPEARKPQPAPLVDLETKYAPPIGMWPRPAPTPQVAAPPAATPARERLRKALVMWKDTPEHPRQDVHELEVELYLAAEAVLNEPAAADGWEAMRELRKACESQSELEVKSFTTDWNCGNRSALLWCMRTIDRLLSRSPAAQAKEAP